MSQLDLTLSIDNYIVRFGLNLKEIRQSRGLSQAEMALRLDMTRQRLCKIEQGKYSLRMESVVKIACLLEVEITELLPTFNE